MTSKDHKLDQQHADGTWSTSDSNLDQFKIELPEVYMCITYFRRVIEAL